MLETPKAKSTRNDHILHSGENDLDITMDNQQETNKITFTIFRILFALKIRKIRKNKKLKIFTPFLLILININKNLLI